MRNLLKIALRNLMRYRRRTFLTASLVAIGVVFVLLFAGITGSFKTLMIGQITDSMLGHLQVHRKGYLASIDNLPLNLNLREPAYRKLQALLDRDAEIEAYSPRIKFGGMFSNFAETTTIRLNGVYPERELRTVPRLAGRLSAGRDGSLERGNIWIPDLMAKSMKVKAGDTVVIVATNQDGSVNGRQFTVSGVLESVTGPGGRDGYIHFEDAVELLRMEEPEVGEVAVRLKDFDRVNDVTARLARALASETNPQGAPLFEVHSWEGLSPFYNVARMLDVMTFFIRLMLIAVVLVSITNVMIMAVYERIREIGTIAAIGTQPGKILSLFVVEGFYLGMIGALAGNALALGIMLVVNRLQIHFNFGRETFVMSASITAMDMLVISGIVVAIAVIASIQPALKASRMEPIAALRHV